MYSWQPYLFLLKLQSKKGREDTHQLLVIHYNLILLLLWVFLTILSDSKINKQRRSCLTDIDVGHCSGFISPHLSQSLGFLTPFTTLNWTDKEADLGHFYWGVPTQRLPMKRWRIDEFFHHDAHHRQQRQSWSRNSSFCCDPNNQQKYTW